MAVGRWTSRRSWDIGLKNLGFSIRINRFLANGGLGSRRRVEELVRSGRVRKNGEVITDLITRVDPLVDVIEVDGEIVLSQYSEHALWMYHKPLNCLCTRDDPKGRPTIFEKLPHLTPPFQAVGRLDQNSTGLLLISRDGKLSQKLMHPSYEITKIYEVLVSGHWSREKVQQLDKGVQMKEGGEGKAKVLKAEVRNNGETFLSLELRRGKKREIRYSMEALEMQVLSLHRVALGPLVLGELEVGACRPLEKAEIEALNALF